jgi:hypothetical protein
MKTRSETELSKIYSKSVLKEHVMGSFDDSRNPEEEKQYKLAIQAFMMQDLYVLWNEIEAQIENPTHKKNLLQKLMNIVDIVQNGEKLPFSAESREEFRTNLVQYLAQ